MKKTNGHRPDPAARQAAATDMRNFDRDLADRMRREDRESVAACALENIHNSEEREKFALLRQKDPAPVALSAGPAAQLELTDKGANGARRLTTAEEDALQAERTAELLSHFHGKQGKHGAWAAKRVAIMLRVRRETDLGLNQLSGEIGLAPSMLLTELAIIAARCHPENWYTAVGAFQRAAEGRTG